MASENAGMISAVWRYPVKSMMGEVVLSTQISEKGIVGDRVYALMDTETGKVVSAKNPKLWPDMFSFRSRYSQPPSPSTAVPVNITLPCGTTVSSSDINVNKVLSSTLGRSVELVSAVPDEPTLEEYWPDMEELDHQDTVTDEAMPAGTFYDLAIIHILSIPTLRKLSSLYPKGQFEVRRFRPNLVVNTDTEQTGFIENEWIGKKIAIGKEVVLNITEPCPRCVMTTLPQGDLPRDTGILRTAAQNNNAHVGVYAEVVHGGTVNCEDRVTVLSD